jgi:hypothetical protein
VTLIDKLLEVVSYLMQVLDELSFPQLAIVAFVLRFAAMHVPAPESSKAPQALGASAMLAYLGHSAMQGSSDVPWLLLYLCRSGFVYIVAAALATPIFYVAANVARFLEQTRIHVEAWYIAWRLYFQDRFFQAQEEARPRPAPQPPVPRAERMRQRAIEAREQFDAEAGVINELPLDEDEREVMLLRARQRMLQEVARLTEI